MENQTTFQSEPQVSQPSLNPTPSQLVSAPSLSSPPVEQAQRNAPTQFLQDLVMRLLPNGQVSMQSNPSQAIAAPTTMPQQVPTPAPQTEISLSPQQDEPSPWAGTPELTEFLQENGVSSVQDLLQYTAQQEQERDQYNEIFEYAMHPDPEVRQAFWDNYNQALQEQGVMEQDSPQAPALPGTPQSDGYYPQQPQTVQSLQHLDQLHRIMNSGMPNVTPQSLAEFDRMILNTPGQWWAQSTMSAWDLA